jgi:hypothetical protein
MSKKSSEVTPGSFYVPEEWDAPEPLTVDERTPEWDRPLDYKVEKKITSYPELVAEYSTFADYFHPKDDVVYYPCCGDDISPTSAFPKSRVIYVDIKDDSVGAKNGFEFHKDSALEFDPGEVDILILQNPQMDPRVPCSHVAPGGYVLSNNYNDTAYKVAEIDGYKLMAVIEKGDDDKLVIVTDDLEGYVTDVETEDEFRASTPGSHYAINYDDAAKIVEAATGKRENVLAEYRTILEGIESAGIPNTLIPKKKASKGDLFVFQKTNKNEGVE